MPDLQQAQERTAKAKGKRIQDQDYVDLSDDEPKGRPDEIGEEDDPTLGTGHDWEDYGDFEDYDDDEL